MVDLDEVDDNDTIFLKELINKHYLNTGSNIAKFILNDFTNQLQYFIKVFPKDFKNVLLNKKKNLVTS